MGISPKQLGIGGILVLLGTGVGWVGHTYVKGESSAPIEFSERSPSPTAIQTAQETITPAPLPASVLPLESNFIASAVNRVGPSVVRIDASRSVSSLSDP